MAKNFTVKLSDNEKNDIAAIDMKNRQKIAKEVAQHQDEFEPASEGPKDKKSIDDIFAFNTLTNDAGMTFTMETLNQDPSESECCKSDGSEDCSYEERRRNAVAGLADAIADLASALVVISSLVESNLTEGN